MTRGLSIGFNGELHQVINISKLGLQDSKGALRFTIREARPS